MKNFHSQHAKICLLVEKRVRLRRVLLFFYKEYFMLFRFNLIISDLIYYRKLSTKFRQIFSLVGFIFIIIPITLFDDHYIPPFPNLYILVPTFGKTLIILFGHKTTLIGYLLNQNILHSAYLWHQPIFEFIRLQYYQTLHFATIPILISVIFVGSIFSYLFIE